MPGADGRVCAGNVDQRGNNLIPLSGFGGSGIVWENTYPSARYPEVRESDHPNVRQEFFQDVLDYARGRGLMTVATLCTTGHAGGYAKAHPECATLAAAGTQHQYLDSAGRHTFNLCHNHPMGQAYARGVIAEVLSRYHGFGGLLFHPPEHVVPCHCSYCKQAFRATSGKELAAASDGDIAAFSWATYMDFQRQVAEEAGALAPGARVFTFNIPGVFDEHFKVVAPRIPRTTTIVYWDYHSYSPEQHTSLLAALDFYRSAGHPVAFTPTSSYNLRLEDPQYGAKVARQIDVVRGAGVKDVLYYHGPIWMEDTIRATSWKRPVTGETM